MLVALTLRVAPATSIQIDPIVMPDFRGTSDLKQRMFANIMFLIGGSSSAPSETHPLLHKTSETLVRIASRNWFWNHSLCGGISITDTHRNWFRNQSLIEASTLVF